MRDQILAKLPPWPKKVWVLAAIGLGLTLLSLAGGIVLATRGLSTKAFYRKETLALKADLDKIQVVLKDSHKLSSVEEFKNYDKQLEMVINRCNRIIKRQESHEKDEVGKAAEKSAKLCQDLVAVTDYQRKLYGQLQGVIMIDIKQLPKQDVPAAVDAVKKMEAEISGAKVGINAISNKRFTDPALGEMNILLDELIALAPRAVSAGKLNPAEYNRLVARLNKVQADLLIRRGYFWYNTVQLDALMQVLDKFSREYA
jgi:cupin superfamily acireductone dioxygenase involved in methionine salvage